MRLSSALAATAVVAGLTACGGSNDGGLAVPNTVCGPGTREKNGKCVPDEDAEKQCGSGTVAVGSECVPVEPDRDCGPGTIEVSGQCVLVPRLGGFDVTVTPVDCATVVSGETDLTVTVVAKDTAGAVLADFEGPVQLVGTAGITVTPALLAGFSAGSASGKVRVAGKAPDAQIIAMDAATLSVRSGSAPFAVEPLQYVPEFVNAPARVREGHSFTVQLRVRSTGCQDHGDFDGSARLYLSGLDGVDVTPSTVPLIGSSVATVVARIEGAGAGTSDVTLHAYVDDSDEEATQDIEIVPRINFAGVAGGFGAPGAAQVYWRPATGGTGSFSYEVFTAINSGQQNFTLAPAVTTSAIAASLGSLINGQKYFVVVRARDGLDDDDDQNSVELRVLPGNVVYVDANNTGGTGTTGDPYQTLDQAVDSGAANIYMVKGTYPEAGNIGSVLSLIPPNTQIIGGFTRSGSTYSINNLDDRSTFITADGAIVPPGFNLSAAAGARLEGINVAGTVGLAGGSLFSITSAGEAQLWRMGLVTNNGRAMTIGSSSGVVVQGVAIDASGAGAYNTVEVSGGSVTLSDVQISGNAAATPLGILSTNAELKVRRALIEDINGACINATGGGSLLIEDGELTNADAGITAAVANPNGLTVRRTRLSQIGGTCIRHSAQGPATLVDNVLDGCAGTGVDIDTTILAPTAGTSFEVAGNSIVNVGSQPIRAKIATSSAGGGNAFLDLDIVGNHVFNSYETSAAVYHRPAIDVIAQARTWSGGAFNVDVDVADNDIFGAGDRSAGVRVLTGKEPYCQTMTYYPVPSECSGAAQVKVGLTATARDNTIRGVSGSAIELVDSYQGGGSSSFAVIGNRIEDVGGRAVRLRASVENSADDFVASVSNNVITRAGLGSMGLGFQTTYEYGCWCNATRLVTTSDQSYSAIDANLNGVANPAEVEVIANQIRDVGTDDFGTTRDAIAGFINSGNGALNARVDVAVSDNLIDGSAGGGISLSTYADQNSSLLINDNIVRRVHGVALGSGAAGYQPMLELRGNRVESFYGAYGGCAGNTTSWTVNSTGTNAVLSVIDNHIVAPLGLMLVVPTKGSFVVHDNVVETERTSTSNPNGLGLALMFLDYPPGSGVSASASIVGNRVLGGSLMLAGYYNGNLTATIESNLVEGAMLQVEAQNPMGDMDITIRNNVVNAPSAFAGINAELGPNGPPSVVIENNTVLTGGTPINVLSASASGTVAIRNNLLQVTSSGDPTSIAVSGTSNITRAYNLLDARDSQTGTDFPAVAAVANVPDGVYFCSTLDNDVPSLEVDPSAPFSVGDVVVLGGEASGRRIIEILPTGATAAMLVLEGDPIIPGVLGLPFLHWREGRFGGAERTYRLLPGSPGVDDGDPSARDLDGSVLDVGAYGGLQPLALP